MEAKKMRSILLEDLNMRWLRKLAKEGRLYFDANEPSQELRMEKGVREVLEYVRAIDCMATPKYADSIGSIWRTIVKDPMLNERLFFTKGRNTGKANRYMIFSIVTVLFSNNVYEGESLLMLHNLLEHTTKKTSVYTGRINYAMEHRQIVRLKRILKDYGEKISV